MTIALWILGYLIVGFVVAVMVERYWPNRRADHGPPILLAFWLWPIVGLTFAALMAPIGIEGAVRWCARRLP